MLEDLKPISGKHSINRVVATVFIPQLFLKPQDIFEKTKNLSGFKDYAKKGLTKATTINIDQNKNTLGISNEQVNGFRFESYDDYGALNNIFKIENNSNKSNQSTISLENRKYSNWLTFRDRIDADFSTFSESNDFYVQAISLNYRDEFIWKGKAGIPVKEIFNIESELLNKKFLDSKNGTLILISQGNEKGYFVEEKTEISFNNDLNRIIIDHHYVSKFDDIKLYSKLKEQDGLNELFDTAHRENKTILKDILTPETQEIIKLN